jgi:alkylation response protein AidB-like acyl-CoA dehydrogenase
MIGGWRGQIKMESTFGQNDDGRRVLAAIGQRAQEMDQGGRWPEQDLAELASVGALSWAVPGEFGGQGLWALEISLRYERIAARSIATALVLSQRDSAVGLLEGANDTALRRRLLADAGAGCGWLTIGIAQLTTSRQGGAPALAAVAVDGGYRLRGVIPWSTGARQSDFIIAGAAVDGTSDQILFALPGDLPGIVIGQPLNLVALAASQTTVIRCEDALLPADHVLAGPMARVLSAARRSVPLPQAFLALGLCRGALDLIGQHDSARARGLVESFGGELEAARKEVIGICQGVDPAAAERMPAVRAICNELALRITHAAVSIYKGSALLANHPAQRLAREALFLLVWSCPDSVIDCTVSRLAGRQAIGEGL